MTGAALIFSAAFAFAHDAHHDLDPPESFHILSCQIGASKELRAWIGGDTAHYSFGPQAAPDLELSQDLSQVTGIAWNGIGRSIWEEITFTNAGHQYAVWYAIDRLTENHDTSGGVRVLKGDQVLAELECNVGSAEVSGFAVSDGFSDAGYCWDRDAQVFSKDCPAQ